LLSILTVIDESFVRCRREKAPAAMRFKERKSRDQLDRDERL